MFWALIVLSLSGNINTELRFNSAETCEQAKEVVMKSFTKRKDTTGQFFVAHCIKTQE